MTREKHPDTGEVRFNHTSLICDLPRGTRSSRQVLMRALKARGVPIKGVFNPQYDPNYSITEWRDPGTGDYIIRWSKIV